LDGLLSVSEARQRLLDAFQPVEIESIALTQAADRVLGEEVRAPLDLPPFANSSMDGFALRAADTISASKEYPIPFTVIADQPAGQASQAVVEPGQAVRIMTGAQIPSGADAVIPVEDTDFHARNPGTVVPKIVHVHRPARLGEFIRPAGQDVREGETVLEPHHRIRPQDIGFLAMLGVSRVLAYRKPRIACLSTGDELVPPGTPLQPGKIYDSNSVMVSALIQRYGGDPISLGTAKDRFEEVKALFDRAVDRGVDLILSTAEVSVGAFDYVRNVVESNGSLEFWRVNMRPGKPFTFGNYRGIHFIGLPGNPVSAFVGFEVFVRPALLKLGGFNRWKIPLQCAILGEPVDSDGRESYLRARVASQDGKAVVYLTGHQGSGNLRSLVQANALLIVPSGVKSLPAGTEVEVWMNDQPLVGAEPDSGE
jgi:molybdopterin molybdotransferase